MEVERLGPYRLEGRLGSGGMGEVYRAYDERLDRKVAIKHIRPEAAGRPEMRERLRREARSAARLSHPAVVQIYDILESEDGDSIVMELVEGQSLAAVLRRGPLDLRRALTLGSQIAAALHAAHTKGVVHRDLKAENVVVTRENQAKVLDFGIAKFLDHSTESPSLTVDGAVIGTFKAMSPEQASGRPVGPSSDLFSLGTLLYEMLTGKSPFKGEGAAETVAQICSKRQDPVRKVRLSVPAELSDLIDQLLEKKPEDRPESAASVATSLGRMAGIVDAEAPASVGTAERTVTYLEAPEVETQTVSERRQITVLRCDLVAAGGEVVDPEELLEELPVFQETVAAVVSRFDGHLWQMPGQSLAVYFGYPHAQEDDARRAVYAALEIVSRTRDSDRLTAGLEARVGLHTGLLVVSQGDGATQAPTTLGDAPDVALAIQKAGRPRDVLISPSTLHLVERFFSSEEAGTAAGHEVGIYRITGKRRTEDRVEVAMAGALKPLVARESELKLLLERWELAAAGRGQVVLLTAEAGVGKTRLLGELLHKLALESPTVLSCYGSPYHKGSSLHPIKKMLGRLLSSSSDAAEQPSLACLEQRLQRHELPLGETVPLFADLLGIPLEGGYEAPEVGPQLQRKRTLEAVLMLLLEMAQGQPQLLVFEDLHWMDPSSLEFLGMLIDQAAAVPLLAVLTFRPEFSPPWRQRSYLTPLNLSPLTESQAGALIEEITGGKPLPASVVEGIVGRSDGVPLFVEELTKSLLESGVLKESGDGYELSGPSHKVHIPATLTDSLMARLDRLGAAKGIAQRAAALGREFSLQLLCAVVPFEEEVLERALDRLVEAELLHRRGFGARSLFHFKHALIRDAAYESLLRSERRKLHCRIAEALEEGFPETVERHPELLAQHWTESGRLAEATGYWYKAGRLALDRSALVEATDHLQRGLQLLGKLPESGERHHRELALLTALGGALSNARGFAAPEVDEAYHRALELCRRIAEAPELFDVYWGLRRFHLVRASLDKALELGDRLVRLAEAEGEPSRLVSAYFSVGATRFCHGEFEQAHAVLERGIQCDSRDRTEHYATQISEDSGVGSLCWDGWSLWFLGFPQQALERIDQAKALAERIKHPLSVTYASLFATYLSFFLHDAKRTLEDATELHALCCQYGSWWDTLAEMFLGWAMAMGGGAADTVTEGGVEGDETRHLEQIERGIEGYRSSGARILQPQMLSVLAEAALVHRRAGLASKSLERARTAIRESGERLYEAEVIRLGGELALVSAEGEADREAVRAAGEAFRQSLEIARHQGARSLQLRAANSAARLCLRQDEKKEAVRLVEPIYGSFSEGFETPDMVEAASLLEELA